MGQSLTKPYYILSPKYQSNSGGIMILYKLKDLLTNLGCEAHIVNNEKAEVPKDAIAVYPEIYSGNPLGCNTVARFVLNAPGRIGGDKIYDEKELVFVFDYMFDKYVKNKIQGRLFIPYIERDLFFNRGWERTLKLSYNGKGPVNQILPKDVQDINVRGPVGRKLLAELLNRAKVLYCFDYATIMMQEAALCGCPVVLLAGNLDEHKLCGFRGNGVCDSISRISEAYKTLPDAVKRMDEVELEAIEQVVKFVFITQRGY